MPSDGMCRLSRVAVSRPLQHPRRPSASYLAMSSAWTRASSGAVRPFPTSRATRTLWQSSPGTVLTFRRASETILTPAATGTSQRRRSGRPTFSNRVSDVVLAEGYDALEAARDVARDQGYRPLILSSRLQGEAWDSGVMHTATADEVRATGNPISPPAVLTSGGETTVTLQ